MKKSIVASLVMATIFVAPVNAQDTYHWPAANTETEVQRFYFSRGTAVALQTTHLVSSKDFKPGDRVYLEVAEPLMFRGKTIIPVGSRVRAEVATVQENGHFGKKGKVEIRVLSMMTPHGPVRLAGSEYDEGKSGAVASFGTMLFVSGLGFIIKGTSGYIEPGTPVSARLAEDLQFSYNPGSPAQALNVREASPDPQFGAAPGFSLSGQ